VLVCKDDREGESAHQNEADRPSRVQIEPAPGYELEAQVSIDEPRQQSAARAFFFRNMGYGRS
jgi:hypothetical protein